MKKSELRAMIREMLHEELDKMKNDKLTEATAIQQGNRYSETPLSAGTVQDAAYNVFLSTEFEDALAQDGGVMGDACADVIYDAALTYWPSANDTQLAMVRSQMEVQLGKIMRDEGVASDYNRPTTDPDIQRIMSNRFDSYGNEY